MVQQVVPRRNLREHLADFSGGFRFGCSTFRPGSLHRRVNLTHFEAPRRSLAAAIKRGVKRRTRSTAATGTLSYVRAWPIRGDRTKRNTPPRAFLSERMAFTKVGGETPGQGGNGPSRETRDTMRATSSARVRRSSCPRKTAAIMPQATASPC